MGRYTYSQPTVSTQRCTYEVYPSGSTVTWTVPNNVYTVSFEVWGGGSAGAPHCCCYCTALFPGFGGGYALKTISTNPGCVYTIYAGCGGPTVYCTVGGVNNGCQGQTSYVTGYNLSNLCATGGGSAGGAGITCGAACTCCGGLAYGGDVCLYGGFAWQMNKTYAFCAMGVGGPAPFGGGATWWQSQNCCPYFSCGHCGLFPGGGGSQGSNCCCDCCYCMGAGGDGFVRITF